MKEQDLKDKFKPYAHGTDVIDNIAHTDNNIWNNSTDQCVQIAKDYAGQEAIEFAEWMHENAGYAGNGHYVVIGHTGYHAIPKLYQLFKNRENER